MQTREELKFEIKRFAQSQTPFFLLLNFEATEGFIFSKEAMQQENILWQFPSVGMGNIQHATPLIEIKRKPVSYAVYAKAFEQVMNHLKYGNSFLTNLTFPTEVECASSLSAIFASSQAKYKICFRDEWVCFSPETFIQIKNQQLYSFPMKGTIDASLPNAQQTLWDDEKETAEHYTIVDLLRNDMSLYGQNVRVERFRYQDKIHTRGKDLWQMSSEIVADLPSDYRHILDEIIFSMLPAGSISGAPKQKTLKIIRESEIYRRGFYTGTAYYFDGTNLDSCVLIRFLEQTPQGLMYKSGGGITTQSDSHKEYEEMISKVYLPIPEDRP
jgi:para-aminobenzoate synthetase component 1